MAAIPADLLDLLEQPTFGHLATVRPDGAPQVEPMWFRFDGEHVRFTHTTTRAKYRNLQQNPAMAMTVSDPGDPYRFIGLRGRLVKIEPDPTGAFYQELAQRYTGDPGKPPPDSADRVVLVMSVDRVVRK